MTERMGGRGRRRAPGLCLLAALLFLLGPPPLVGARPLSAERKKVDAAERFQPLETDSHVYDVALYAVASLNELDDTEDVGERLELSQVLSARKQIVAGVLWFLSLEVSSLIRPDMPTKKYEVTVYEPFGSQVMKLTQHRQVGVPMKKKYKPPREEEMAGGAGGRGWSDGGAGAGGAGGRAGGGGAGPGGGAGDSAGLNDAIPRMGVFEPADIEDPDVSIAAAFATSELTRKSESDDSTHLIEVVRAKKQLLAGGTNFVVVVRVAEGSGPERLVEATVHKAASGDFSVDDEHEVMA